MSDNLCNCKTINVITKDIDKKFLLDIIDKIDDPKIKKKYLTKLKYIIYQENQLSDSQPFSLNKIFEKYPTQSLFKQVTTGELKNEVKQLKSQIKELQLIVNQHELKQLQTDARLSLIEAKNNIQASTSNSNQAHNSCKKKCSFSCFSYVTRSGVIKEAPWMETILPYEERQDGSRWLRLLQ